MGRESEFCNHCPNQSKIRVPWDRCRTCHAEHATCGVELWSRIRNLYRREHGSDAKRLRNTRGAEPDDRHRFRLSYSEDHGQEEEPTTTIAGRVCRALWQPSRPQEAERINPSTSL